MASAAALGIVAVATPAGAYDVKQTSHGDPVHWDESEVHFAFDASLDALAGSQPAVDAAFQSWSGHVGAPILVTDRAAETLRPGFDRKNTITFAPKGHAAAGKALAITVLTYDNNSGRVLDADVIVNGRYHFAVLPADARKTDRIQSMDGIGHEDSEEEPTEIDVYDLHHVVAHEAGHTLGMNDETDKHDTLMYRYSSANDASIRTPVGDDIEGLSQLYGDQVHGEGGCGNATVAPHKPSNEAGAAALALLLGFAAFVVLRQKASRTRVSFALASAVATFALASVPSVSVATEAKASTFVAPGHARAVVSEARTTVGDDGLFRTELKMSTKACRAGGCPKVATMTTWGGVRGDLRQEVGGFYAPSVGSEVDVSFAKLPSALAPAANPLAGRAVMNSGLAKVVTAIRK